MLRFTRRRWPPCTPSDRPLERRIVTLPDIWLNFGFEPEIAFADLAENMAVAEGFIKHVMGACLENNNLDMQILETFEASKLSQEEKGDEKAEQAKGGKAKGKKTSTTGKKTPSKQPAKPKHWRAVPLRERVSAIVNSQFAKVTYTEAINILWLSLRRATSSITRCSGE